MLVTSRACDPEQNHWSVSKYETLFHKPTTINPRMSNFEPPLSTQPEWQGQYSYMPPGESSIFSQPYEHTTSSSDNQAPQTQTRPPLPTLTVDTKTEPGLHGSAHSSRRNADPLGLRAPKASPPTQEASDAAGDVYAQKAAESVVEESLVSTDTPGQSLGSNPMSSVSSGGQPQDIQSAQAGTGDLSGIKEQDDDVIDDDDMIDGDGDAPAPAQTAAERTAQRRKMKRFRLTHQQTRFLMSEFAKQPHPDAAHRERLSREIPGLSPRQVQVWFQNRRAKIKRLTADDRDRMIKMRAVPDDFDNVQALHSPYGAVHGLGPPMASPVDFGGQSYAEHMMRPLMVDVRRGEADEHMSPTGLSPAFGSIGFNPSAAMSSPDLLSPLSPTSGGDRYGYSNHLSGPLSAGAGPRSANPFARQGSLDAGVQMHGHNPRQQIRPLQPLHLRDTMTRTRSDTLQSPLRTSMSWKGDAIDYTTYHGGSGSPPMGGARQPPVFPADQMAAGASAGGLGGYDSNNYSGSSVQSPTHMNYPAFPSSNMQQNPQNRSRMRAASASLPLGLDLRTQFRSVSSAHSLSPTAHSPGGARPNASGQIGGVTSSYTASFPSAPLTAPIDYSLPRAQSYRTSGPDYSMSQMSAPISQPNDFSHAFQTGMGNSSSRTPMRDSYGAGADRQDEYSHDPLGMHRKRSYTGPSSTPTAASQTYGNTT